MTILKECADFFRASIASSGGKLRSGHAHELASAFFGYPTAAALRAEQQYPLSDLHHANVLFPFIQMIEKRRAELQNLPVDLPSSDRLARDLSDHLKVLGHFNGSYWVAARFG